MKNIIYKCPECGWIYKPEERAQHEGISIEDCIKAVPLHPMLGSKSFLCDGANEKPIVEYQVIKDV